MFADSRFDYLTRVRYYAAMLATPVHFLADLPGRALDGGLGMFQSRSDLQADNERLQEQLLMQQYELQKLAHLTAENRRLNDLLKASSVVDEVVVRVQLTGESPDPFVKRVRINKGSLEGVYVGQPVLDADGLMGQVVEVEPLNSWVLLITDPQHSTPVQVNRNGVRAIASGTRDGLHTLSLNNLPNTADIVVGDELVTSGLGQRFPAGYPVGVVSSIVHDPGKPFADVLVVPTAQIDRSRNLLLVFEQQAAAANPAQSPLPPTEETVPGAGEQNPAGEIPAGNETGVAPGNTEAQSAPEDAPARGVD
jgi:rod shape-determining protein MreC